VASIRVGVAINVDVFIGVIVKVGNAVCVETGTRVSACGYFGEQPARMKQIRISKTNCREAIFLMNTSLLTEQDIHISKIFIERIPVSKS